MQINTAHQYSSPTEGLLGYAGLYNHSNNQTVLLNMEKKALKFDIFTLLDPCPCVIFVILPCIPERLLWPRLMEII